MDVASAILKTVKKAGNTTAESVAAVKKVVSELSAGCKQRSSATNQAERMRWRTKSPKLIVEARFGKFGWQFIFIPETLSEAFREIEEQYENIKDDPAFLAELIQLAGGK